MHGKFHMKNYKENSYSELADEKLGVNFHCFDLKLQSKLASDAYLYIANYGAIRKTAWQCCFEFKIVPVTIQYVIIDEQITNLSATYLFHILCINVS